MQTLSAGGTSALIDIDRQDRIRAIRLVGLQAVFVFALALPGLLVQLPVAISLFVGGAIGVAGSLWLALMAYRLPATRPAKEILVSFYVGEIGRFLIVMILFIVAFKYLVLLGHPRNALVMFLAFAASQVAIALAPRLVDKFGKT